MGNYSAPSTHLLNATTSTTVLPVHTFLMLPPRRQCSQNYAATSTTVLPELCCHLNYSAPSTHLLNATTSTTVLPGLCCHLNYSAPSTHLLFFVYKIIISADKTV